MPDFDVSRKVPVGTGASRGLGRQIAFANARHGASVVIASRKLDACVTVAGEITRDTGQGALGTGCHIGDWPSSATAE